MKIKSFTAILAMPFVAWAGYYIYNIVTTYDNNSEIVVVPVIVLAALYAGSGYIDNWWLRKNTPELDTKMVDWLNTHLPYYQKGKSDYQNEFAKRLVLYIETREFKMVGSQELKEVPYDLSAIIASQAVRLCLGLEDYLIKDLDRIYMYKHPFPTPNLKYLHTVEADVEDGVVILCTEYAFPGITHPDQFFNIALYGFADAFQKLHPNLQWPRIDDDWGDLDKISILNKHKLKAITGLHELNKIAIHIVAFFDYADDYKKYFYNEHERFKQIFNQDPSIS